MEPVKYATYAATVNTQLSGDEPGRGIIEAVSVAPDLGPVESSPKITPPAISRADAKV